MDMKSPALLSVLAVVLGAAALSSCDDGRTNRSGPSAEPTRFPGQVSAGSATGGEIMARAASGQPEPATGEAVRGQAAQGNVSGTPSIPEGAGGNPSGAALGGTTPAAAASQIAPAPGAPGSPSVGKADDAAAKERVAAQMEKEKQDLANAMDRVSERWRSRAQQQGGQVHRPVRNDALPGAQPRAAEAAAPSPAQPQQNSAPSQAPGQGAAVQGR